MDQQEALSDRILGQTEGIAGPQDNQRRPVCHPLKPAPLPTVVDAMKSTGDGDTELLLVLTLKEEEAVEQEEDVDHELSVEVVRSVWEGHHRRGQPQARAVGGNRLTS